MSISSQTRGCNAELVVFLEKQLAAAEAEAEKWKHEALQQYPTPEAYDAACNALNNYKAENKRLREALQQKTEEWRNKKDHYGWNYGIKDFADELEELLRLHLDDGE